MASPAVTYTFSNSTTASATEVNQNFTDLINALTDGSKDLSVSALTAAGTATLNGNVNLGNSSSDDLSITAALASSISIKTTATYNVGSSTLGLLSIYFGGASSYTARILASASQSATYTLTLPTTVGTKGYVPYNSDGAGVLTWTPGQTGTNAVASADYTILDADGYYHILVTTGASNRTITLPAAANNSGRKIFIKKADSGAGQVILSGTIEGGATNIIYKQYGYCRLISDGSSWYFDDEITEEGSYTLSATGGTNVAAISDVAAYYKRKGKWIHVECSANVDPTSATTLTDFTVNLPIAHAGTPGRYVVLGTSYVATQPAYWGNSNTSATAPSIRGYPNSLSNQTVSLSFQYSLA
jgi:hypothetical protein